MYHKTSEAQGKIDNINNYSYFAPVWFQASVDRRQLAVNAKML